MASLTGSRTSTRPRTGAAAVDRRARRAVWHAVAGGVLAGGIAGMVMAAWTMVASATFNDGVGFFTPMYVIAAPFTGADEALLSLGAAPDDVFWWSTSEALLGAGIHLVNSMVLGAVFGVVVGLAKPRPLPALLTGVLYGLGALGVMTFLVAPLAEELLGGEPVVADIGKIIGWPTWTIAHVLFGAVLGLWAARPVPDIEDVRGPALP